VEDGKLSPEAAAWVQRVADQDYGGDFGRAAAAIIESAHAREARPDARWAELEMRQRLSVQARSGRR
jgi:hypothetical protein